MQHDEVIWQVINHGHCSYRSKTQTQNFCRNEYNVTGLCNRSSCPLANSRYATIKEHEGVLYLYMKTIERSFMPSKLWERVKLPRNYGKALEMIDKYLEHWPKFLVHKNKQRLTKMTQYLIRMRKLALQARPKLVTMPAKQVQREARREAKAEVAAVLELAIEKELLQRLQSGTYGDIYNFPVKEYEKVLEMEEVGAENGGAELEEEEDEEEEEPQVEYVEGDYEDEDDLEDFGAGPLDKDLVSVEDLKLDEASDEEAASLETKKRPRKVFRVVPRTKAKGLPPADEAGIKRKRRRPHVEIEYEHEPHRTTQF